MNVAYKKSIDSRHSIFNVTVKTDQCLDLCAKKFASKLNQLTDKFDYSYCHAIGDWAVNQKNTEIIRFESARNTGYINVAVAEPISIRSKAP